MSDINELIQLEEIGGFFPRPGKGNYYKDVYAARDAASNKAIASKFDKSLGPDLSDPQGMRLRVAGAQVDKSLGPEFRDKAYTANLTKGFKFDKSLGPDFADPKAMASKVASLRTPNETTKEAGRGLWQGIKDTASNPKVQAGAAIGGAALGAGYAAKKYLQRRKARRR